MKSRRGVAALALALAAVGGSVAAVRAVTQGPANTAPAALPAPAGRAATAAAPARDGAALSGTGASGTGRASGTASGTAAGPGSAVAGGRGAPGPGASPAGTLPADGAVPGASPALRALAAARAATTALPHSPRLLSELRGPALPGGAAGTAYPAAAVPAASPSPSNSPSNSPSPSPSPTPTGSPPPAAAVAGLDVASYQHKNGAPISWTQVAAAGYRFAAVKATEGDYYINPWAATDLAAAKAAGLYVTAYHFAIPNGSGGAAQARFAVASSGYASGPRMLPLMLDIEYDPYVKSDHTNECYGLSAVSMTAWLTAFVTTARQLTGQYPVIYTTADWWNTCTGGATTFGADPMWVAAYGSASPPMPAGWTDWTYWQYTSGGTVPGVPTPGATDLNHFNVKLPGLVSPGSQASRPGIRVSLRIPALAALAGTPLAYSVSGLPIGLWISPGGLITGLLGGAVSARQAATYHVTVSATTAGGKTGAVTFSWQVAASCGPYLTAGACPGA